MQKKARKISIIGLIIIVFIVKEAAWLCVIQPFRGIDEIAHYRYVQTLFNEQRLPTLGQTLFREGIKAGGMTPGQADDTITIAGPLQSKSGYQINYIAQHPPLYYIALLPVYAILQHQNNITIMIAMRIVSVLMMAVSLYFIFKTIKKLLPENRILPEAVTVAIAFLPTFSYVSGLINNDNLLAPLSAILIYLLVERNASQKAGTGHESVMKWSIKTGIVLGLLALTKMTALPLFLVVLIIRIIDFFKAKEPAKRKSVIYSTLIIFAIPLAVAGWWYLRNFMLYGTFFATLREAVVVNPKIITAFPAILKFFPDINPAATMKIGVVDFFITKNFFVEYYKNIWGSASGFAELITSWQFVGIVIFTFLGVIGQIMNLYKNRIAKGGLIKRAHDFLASGQGILFLTFVILLSSLAWKIYEMSSLRGYMSAMHGRYFLAAAPALMYMLLRGWEYLTGKKWAGKATVVLIALFVLNDAVSLIHTGPFLFH
jgi:hypothetical protein